MPVYVSLLRGINVGGNKKIKMAALREVYQSLGLARPQTLLQSGNAVFESQLTEPAELARQIEAGIEQHFGFDVRVFIRTAAEWRDVVARNPFAADHDPARLLVMFFSTAPDPAAVDRLRQAHTGPEEMHLSGQELFLYYPDGMGRSKLSNTLIEKTLKLAGTGRNWATVNKLVDLSSSYETG
jgi:uncharacterized protein (DUF1697 family)